MAAQIGGLVQSATVSAGLLAEHLVTGPQVLLAMLISSAARKPIRTLRRNLPLWPFSRCAQLSSLW